MKPATRTAIVLALALIAVTVALFWPVTRCDFINYDDPDYVTDNPHVLNGLTAEGMAWAFQTRHSNNWHPLTWISHMLDFQIFGVQPGGHHVMNLFWHVINTVLLFWMLQRWTSAPGPSLFVAALFAWHPAHVESVAWIAERKDVLSTFFALLALSAYARYAQGPLSQSSTPRFQGVKPGFRPLTSVWYWLALLSFALGLMTKPMLVTLPFLMLLLDYWPLTRVSDDAVSPRIVRQPVPEEIGADLGTVHRAPMLWLVLEKLPFFLLSAVSCLITVLAQTEGGAVQGLARFSVSQRITNVSVSYARYLAECFWPRHLAVFYPLPAHWPAIQAVFAGALLIGLSLAAWRLRRRVPFLFTGWFWFVGTLIPVIGLLQVGRQAMADRYTYWPFIGLFILVAWGLNSLLAQWGLSRSVSAILAACACIACASRTRDQLRHWQNSETLFTHALAVTTNNAEAWLHLGLALHESGQVSRALECYRNAIQIEPGFLEAQNNLGIALVRLDRADEALEHYAGALRLRPGSAQLHNNLGLTLAHLGRWEEAIHEYSEAVRLDPEYPETRNNLGHALSALGKLDEAMVQLRRAIELRPDLAEAHYNLANALNLSRHLEEAITEYRISTRLKPRLSEAQDRLSSALLSLGRADEAVAAGRNAVRQQPARSDFHLHLAQALRASGNLDQAMVEYQTVLRLNPALAGAHYELADLLAQNGRCPDAIVHYQAGLQTAPENAEAHVCIAVCLLKEGKRQQARVQLSEALQLKPDHARAVQLLQALDAAADSVP